MAEVEKVVKELARIREDHFGGMTSYEGEVIDAAISLLKAQEPIAPVKVNRYMETDENGDWFTPETYDCGNCGVELHGKANYCHLCGRAVKWG